MKIKDIFTVIFKRQTKKPEAQPMMTLLHFRQLAIEIAIENGISEENANKYLIVKASTLHLEIGIRYDISVISGTDRTQVHTFETDSRTPQSALLAFKEKFRVMNAQKSQSVDIVIGQSIED